MTEAKRPLKVFLCHAHADRDAVRGLYARLTKDGVDAWLDKEKLLPGQDWELEIRKAVREADVVVVCLSKQFNQDGFRQKEVRLALDVAMEKREDAIFIIPARLEECDTLESLKKWHWVDLFEADGYEMLMRALRTRAEKIGVTLKIKKSRSSKRPDAQEKIEEVSKSLPADTIVSVLYPTAQNESNPISSRKSNTESQSEKVSPIRINSGGILSVSDSVKKDAESPAFQKDIAKKTDVEVRKDKTDKQAKKRVRLKTEYVVAIIGAVATIVAGILSSPIIENWFSPAPVSTELATATITMTSQPIVPSKTIEPNQTSTKIVLPTIVFNPHADASDYIDAFGVPMRLVPAGKFIMGSDEGQSTAKPAHDVKLDAFYLDKYEVTNSLYKACVDVGVCKMPNQISRGNAGAFYYGNSLYDNYPVVYVDWSMAKTYCEWRSARLPDEAEWEKAARGTDGRKYPWGNNYSDQEKDMSSYGIYDMGYSVNEWVLDWFEVYPGGDPKASPAFGQKFRVTRGFTGSFRSDYQDASPIIIRLPGVPESGDSDLGFRCAKDVTP